ncbi:hypothetical protein CkaCkLH20_05374 [Colletotrichum karsti]|uniref:Uncharacterized protein n=1 Tax=Colletotrichum karsti TaxID=1095194 RepID=A0A9P6LKU8_9PEZI|nr:uncharacterized protein CkaCkLH20_05374 [Colletotrichum karsti]KAF9877108.1 hypothetical protein CkaCkLH20_05374 [Colletotrichum karsti]
MKFLALSSLVVAASAAVVDKLEARGDGCNADNCLRAVRATRFGTATMVLRMAECSSYLAVTETASASTIFVTETSIATVTANTTQTIYQRAVETPLPTKEIPAYATACPDDAAYRSACSCFGATAVTTTAPAPIVTSTVSFVATTTVAPFVNVTRPAVSCDKPWTCGDNVIPTCSLDLTAGEKGCVCFRTVEGRDVCAVPNDCKPSCDTTNDCGNGEVCIKQSCCLGGTCMKVDVCLNQVLPKMLFKKRAGNRAWVKRQANADFSKLSLMPHDASSEEE